jgi:hypothetical protein
MPKEKNGQLGGKVVRVVPTGLCFVEEASSGKVYPFTFDKIRGYRGETVRELGLRSGLSIRFTTGETDLIDSVELHA